VTGRTARPTGWVAEILLWFAVVLGGAVASGELLRLAERPDGSTGLDRSITSWSVAHRTHLLTTLAKWLSTVGSQKILLPLVAIVAVALVSRRRFASAGLLLGIWGGAILLYTVAKDIVGRPRPPRELWLTNAGGQALPSGHAVQSLSTFVALALVGSVWSPRARLPGVMLALVLAAGVGWSRVYLGVHWATDVAIGWVIAAA
jgi:membrane-associated phospholipid phosphatase